MIPTTDEIFIHLGNYSSLLSVDKTKSVSITRLGDKFMLEKGKAATSDSESSDESDEDSSEVKKPKPTWLAMMMDESAYHRVEDIFSSVASVTEGKNKSIYRASLDTRNHDLGSIKRIVFDTQWGEMPYLHLDGHCTVSAKEYGRKINDNPEVNISIGRELGICRSLVTYENAILQARSVQAGMVHFILNNKQTKG